MKESEWFQFGNQIEVEDLGDGVKRQLYGFNGQLMMVKVIFEKGAIGTLLIMSILRSLMLKVVFLK